MAVTLVESAKLSQNDLQRGVIETFVQTSPILDRLPLMPIEGNAYAYNAEGALPGIAFRSVNEAYTESTGTVNQRTESLVIMGGDADAYLATQGDVWDTQWDMFLALCGSILAQLALARLHDCQLGLRPERAGG